LLLVINKSRPSLTEICRSSRL